MKKLMILGASEPQARLTKAAKELGYYTIVVSPDGNYPGLKEGDEIFYCDIKDKEAVLEYAKSKQIDGITSCCFDIPLETIGYVNDNLNLSGLTFKSAVLASDKFEMKRAFMDYGVSTARFKELYSKSDLEKSFNELNFPLILKAVDLAGSQGIYVVRNEEEALKYYEDVMAATKKDYCIIEEFIEGEDFGAQAFVYNGDILFTLIHGDSVYVDHTAMPIGHYAPYILPEKVEKDAIECCERAIRSLGLNNCGVNIDMIIKDDRVYMIELTGRAGATCLPELVSIYYGIDYYKALAMVAVGDDPREIFQSIEKPYVPNDSMLLMSKKNGIVKSVKNTNDPDGIYELTIDVKPGDRVNKYKSSKDKIGQIVTKGVTLDAARERLKEALENIEIIVE